MISRNLFQCLKSTVKQNLQGLSYIRYYSTLSTSSSFENVIQNHEIDNQSQNQPIDELDQLISQSSVPIDNTIPQLPMSKLAPTWLEKKTQYHFQKVINCINYEKDFIKAFDGYCGLHVAHYQPIAVSYQYLFEFCLKKKEDYYTDVAKRLMDYLFANHKSIEAPQLLIYNRLFNKDIYFMLMDKLKNQSDNIKHSVLDGMILGYLKYDLYEMALQVYCDRILEYRLSTSYKLDTLFALYHKSKGGKVNGELFDFWSKNIQKNDKKWDDTKELYQNCNTYKIVHQINQFCGRETKHYRNPILDLDFYEPLENAIQSGNHMDILKILQKEVFPRTSYLTGTTLMRALLVLRKNRDDAQMSAVEYPEYIRVLFKNMDIGTELYNNADVGLQELAKKNIYDLDVRTKNSLVIGLMKSGSFNEAVQMLTHLCDTRQPLFILDTFSVLAIRYYDEMKPKLHKLLSKINENLQHFNFRSSVGFSNLMFKQNFENNKQLYKTNPEAAERIFKGYLASNLKNKHSIPIGLDIAELRYPIPPESNLEQWDQILFDALKKKVADKYFVQALILKLMRLGQHKLVNKYISENPTVFLDLPQTALLAYLKTIIDQPEQIINIFVQLHYTRDNYLREIINIVETANKTEKNQKCTEMLLFIQSQNRIKDEIIDSPPKLSTISKEYLKDNINIGIEITTNDIATEEIDRTPKYITIDGYTTRVTSIGFCIPNPGRRPGRYGIFEEDYEEMDESDFSGSQEHVEDPLPTTGLDISVQESISPEIINNNNNLNILINDNNNIKKSIKRDNNGKDYNNKSHKIILLMSDQEKENIEEEQQKIMKDKLQLKYKKERQLKLKLKKQKERVQKQREELLKEEERKKKLKELENQELEAAVYSEEMLEQATKNVSCSSEWLTSSALSFFCWNFGNVKSRSDYCYINEEFFLDVLADKPKDKVGELAVQRIKANNFSFYAINDNNVHWLGMLVDKSSKTITVYDPSMNRAYIKWAEKLNVYLLKLGAVKSGDFKINLERGFCGQADGFSCGIYLCNIIYCIFNNKLDLLFKNQNQIKKFRGMMSLSFKKLLDNKPSSFNWSG
ncbi:cyclophilin-type peptidylprolyl cis-trans isomerase [Tieghemostelium lacteum]|uniref:Cyclophilin-type peptidylprolyl cis-trans isomerase n=1 Tax=Tieghemostelium lacteum TaxID=361077 RepID=A0A151ZH04_TIELA|nr:cyclophilin-type peptidylprolyl cis-trans isomerase [Tieghemostelium lacteum]|eukprot:KYQ93144.1 cyclophilin-type peptidylprolyl cis-trans isomerase [Tieghemostelium lacteum]